MSILKKKDELQEAILMFLDDDNNENPENSYKKLLQQIDSNNVKNNRSELCSLLHLISNIINNHHRTPDFFIKLEKIFNLFKNEITKNLSNSKLFQIFRKSKLILLFLIENKMIIPTKNIYDVIMNQKYQKKFYLHFFYPEFEKFYDETIKTKISKEINFDCFEENRRIGENNAQICQIIKKDSIDEFCTFIDENKLNLKSTKIDSSIFETNSFLLDKNPTLLEYSAFFGSINIFKYLISKEVELTPSIWLYGIHSNNLEIIKILQENNIEPEDKSYRECFIESIKCFHNEMSNYIETNKLQQAKLESIFIQCMKFNNYHYFPNPQLLIKQEAFYNLCKYDYACFVELLIDNNDIDVNFAIDQSNKKPIIVATEKGNEEIVSILAKHPSIDINYQIITKFQVLYSLQ